RERVVLFAPKASAISDPQPPGATADDKGVGFRMAGVNRIHNGIPSLVGIIVPGVVTPLHGVAPGVGRFITALMRAPAATVTGPNVLRPDAEVFVRTGA